MDRQLIKTLIDALQSSGLSELEYTSGSETLRLVKGGTTPGDHAIAPPAASSSVPAAPVGPPPSPNGTPAGAAGALVRAPLYGVVHLQPVPGAAPFVITGQAVGAGQVLCTLEAMKVFTEVRAERAGTVEAVLVTDGQEVEPGQTLVQLA
jgi:acetyl-CoA carboxylase biotin carboxyl carrier protein